MLDNGIHGCGIPVMQKRHGALDLYASRCQRQSACFACGSSVPEASTRSTSHRFSCGASKVSPSCSASSETEPLECRNLRQGRQIGSCYTPFADTTIKPATLRVWAMFAHVTSWQFRCLTFRKTPAAKASCRA